MVTSCARGQWLWCGVGVWCCGDGSLVMLWQCGEWRVCGWLNNDLVVEAAAPTRHSTDEPPAAGILSCGRTRQNTHPARAGPPRTEPPGCRWRWGAAAGTRSRLA
jgi:hypothetical protein